MPRFLLQIVDVTTGELARFPAGTRAGLERPLIEACTQAIVSKGVGLWRTEAHVKAAIEQGITEVVRGLKEDTRYLP